MADKDEKEKEGEEKPENPGTDKPAGGDEKETDAVEEITEELEGAVETIKETAKTDPDRAEKMIERLDAWLEKATENLTSKVSEKLQTQLAEKISPLEKLLKKALGTGEDKTPPAPLEPPTESQPTKPETSNTQQTDGPPKSEDASPDKKAKPQGGIKLI